MGRIISTFDVKNSYEQALIGLNLAISILNQTNTEVAVADLSSDSDNQDLQFLLNLQSSKSSTSHISNYNEDIFEDNCKNPLIRKI